MVYYPWSWDKRKHRTTLCRPSWHLTYKALWSYSFLSKASSYQFSFKAPTEVITLMYLYYIVGIIFGPLTGKLIYQICDGATIALGAVAFGFNIESLAPPCLAESSTFHNTMWITPHPCGVNSKPGSLGSDFCCCSCDQELKGYQQELHNKKKSIEIWYG